MEPGRRRRRVRGVAGRPGAGSSVAPRGRVVLGSACQAEWVDVVPWVHGSRVAGASVQRGEAEGDGNVAAGDPEGASRGR